MEHEADSSAESLLEDEDFGAQTLRIKAVKTSTPLYGRIFTVLVCAFLAFCTAIGPIYRHNGSIAHFSQHNGVIFALAFAFYWVVIAALTWLSRRQMRRPSNNLAQRHPHVFWLFFAILLIGWAWVSIILRTGFGADLNSQIAEVQQWLYGTSPSDVFQASVPAYESYPIARYLLPNAHVRLTDQHNILLTLLYGLVANESYKLTGSVRRGIEILSAAQYVFAAFCTASAFSRFLRYSPRRPRRMVSLVALAILLLSPMVTLSTVALTKSPFFSFAYVWWTGVLYELLHARRGVRKTRWQTVVAFIVSTFAMLISAKFALYIVVIELCVLCIWRARSWRTWIACLLVPAVVFSVGLHWAKASGAVVAGDSIESKGLQIQQIARIEKTDPSAISAASRAKLSKIFDLPAMAKAYEPVSSEPVKSSGEFRKLGSYRWQTVSAADWQQFTGAWWQAVRAAPLPALDALLAEMYGYFDITDKPSTPITYYSANDVMDRMLGARLMNQPIRLHVMRFFARWSRTPVLKYLMQGNFWTILTLLLICVQLRNRRLRELLWTLPMLVQMAVMVAAPAGNFDRLEICLALTAPLLLIDALAGRAT